MAGSPRPRINLKPGPFFRTAAERLDVRSRRGLPVTAAATLAVLAFLGFLSIAEDTIEPAVIWMDRVAQASVMAIRTPAMTEIFRVLTALGDTRVVIVETLVAAMLLAAWGHPRRAGSVAILVLTGSVVSIVAKGIVERLRPEAALALIAEPTSPSFPSGHALAGVLLFGTLALMLAVSKERRWIRIWGSIAVTVFGLSIGVSRVYLGVHYASDVLASWLLGLTMLSAWSAAVLVWGRSQPPAETRPVARWGTTWWRWGLVVLGLVAVVLSVIDELTVVRLL